MNRFLILVLLSLPLVSVAQQKVEITEEFFRGIDEKNTPEIQKIEANYQNVKSQNLQLKQAFGVNAFGSVSYGQSNERSLSQYVPVNSTLGGAELGLRKNTTYGVSLQTSLFNQRSTNNFLTDANTNGLKIGINFDLMKDFLGKTSKSRIESSSLTVKEMELMRKIQKKQFQNNLRKTYWNLVASQEGIKVSERLLKSAEGHLKEAIEKRKSGLGSKGQVARFYSLVADRKAQLNNLRVQHAMKIEGLKRMLPQLEGKKVELGKYNLDKKVMQFFQCSGLIEDKSKTPYEYTLYDEVLGFKKERFSKQTKVINEYSRPDIKLAAEYTLNGKGFSFDKANDDFKDDGRGSYTVGLQFEVPLSGTAGKAERAQLAAAKSQYIAEQKILDTQLHTVHREVSSSLKLLREVILNRMENKKHIRNLLDDSNRKYRQARISSKNLVDDQDMQLNNELNVIEIQAQIIFVMLDYFSVFTEVPCELNNL